MLSPIMEQAKKRFCEDLEYMLISDLPESEAVDLRKWMDGKTTTIIEEEGENKFNCVYYWDYERWLRLRRK